MEKNQELPKSSSWYQYFGLYNEQTKVPFPLKRIFVNVTLTNILQRLHILSFIITTKIIIKLRQSTFFQSQVQLVFINLQLNLVQQLLKA